MSQMDGSLINSIAMMMVREDKTKHLNVLSSRYETFVVVNILDFSIKFTDISTPNTIERSKLIELVGAKCI